MLMSGITFRLQLQEPLRIVLFVKVSFFGIVYKIVCVSLQDHGNQLTRGFF